MAEYKGNNVVVEFTTDISATLTRVEINEEAAEPKEIDITHSGDVSPQSLEGLPGQPKIRITVSAWDESGAASDIWLYPIGTKSDLVVYPEGKTSGKPMRTIADAVLVRRSQPVEVEAAVKWDAEFSAIGSVTEGTYTA